MTAAVESGAQGIRWDLTPLAPDAEAMKERLEAAVAAAAAFVERRPAEAIEAIEAAELTELLGELADLRATRKEAEKWATLLTWTDSENPDALDVQAWVNDRLPSVDEAIRHFELAWMDVPDDRARALAADPAVARDAHYLLSLRRFRPYTLSGAEERVLSVRDASATAAWKNLRDRTLGALVATFDDGDGEREMPLAEIGALRRLHPDREVRRRAQLAFNDLIEPELPVIGHCYDSLVADRLAVDRLRGYGDPMEQTNLGNEIDGRVVESLLAASEAHAEIGRRWLREKARLMGLERLDAVDLYASTVDEAPGVSWENGRRIVVEMFTGLSPVLGDEADRFFAESRIDAEPRRGKPSGAFCDWPSTRVPGFVFLNWHGQLHDLLTLAHELGHGTHFALAARAQTDNSYMCGVTVAEVPSTFAELRLVDELLDRDDRLGRAGLSHSLDTAVVVAFVASAFARFEQQAYSLRAEGQALNPERLGDLCAGSVNRVFGDAITDELDSYRDLWASMPHFVHERFYTYAYTFAFLIAAVLVGRSREPGFGERYERFLAAGGSAPPEELLAMVDVDLGDPDIWNDGFAVLDGFLDRV